MKRNYDTAVIGGGLAGLVAAIKVAQSGRSVVLLERSNRLGGRAMTNHNNGVYLNLGGHALYKAGRANSVLQELGIRVEGGKPSTKMNVIWNKQLVPMGADPIGMMKTKLLTWSSKMQLMRLMVKLSRLNADTIPASSIREWAEREVQDPMVRHVFYALCRTATYAFDPDRQLAGPALGQIQRSLKGVIYLNKGWQTIVDQLRAKAQQIGVQIESGKSVKEITHKEGKVTALELGDGTSISITNVVSTASPSETYKLVPGAEATVLNQWKTEAVASMAACLDIGLKKLPVKEHEFALGLDQPIFFSNHSAHATMSDNGAVVVHLIKYNGPGESDPKADEQQLLETMNWLQPGWENEVLAKQFLPNITVTQGYPRTGQKSKNIGPNVPGIQGLYVAGDWAGHGELLADASVASAVRASEAIAKHSPSLAAAR
ncbi:NAD(P)/FAD-dependent oxidoreductase [Paenibacillus sp. BC26]|uniref:phytoene desaturase family protein n=1 Tax=Paenibacillus sp. BC26 TaxID=1881032 RepID=UPI0008EA3524|nr:FAD-dependent oxidoreductase [Paenibacillus sp. BC26]SFS52687.1 Phytoene dehydrogenase-related protein [Paenibacillus sp. BC26]